MPTAQVYISTVDKNLSTEARILSEKLRAQGLNVAMDISGKKLSDQLKIADKQAVPHVIVLGEDEIKSGIYSVKNMKTGEEKKGKLEEIPGIIFGR